MNERQLIEAIKALSSIIGFSTGPANEAAEKKLVILINLLPETLVPELTNWGNIQYTPSGPMPTIIQPL